MTRFCTAHFSQLRRSGQALIDYVLPLAVVSALILSFSTTVYPEFRNYLVGVFNTELNTPKEKKLIGRQLGKDPNMTTVALVLPNGGLIRLDQYPRSLSQSIETVGTDGTTTLLADNILSLAKQLLEKEEITQEQFNNLSDMANQAHRMGELQSLVKQAASDANGDREKFLGMKLSYGPFSGMKPDEISFLAGRTHQGGGINPSLVNSVPEDLQATLLHYEPSLLAFNERAYQWSDIKVGPEMLQFLQFSKAANDSGALKNPAVKQFVDLMAGDVFSVANNFNFQTSSISTFEDYNPAQLEQNMADSYTHHDAMAICSAGGTEDTGVYCSK